MKWLGILLFLLFFIKLQAQNNSTNNVDSVLSSAVNNLGGNKFYFISQLHNNEANTVIEKDLLLSLNKRFNVHYDIIEFAHSIAFLLNLYLNTGQDSLLKFINSKANFNFIKSVKSFNDTVDSSKKIKFFGVDFEGRNNGKFTKKAIEIISSKIKLSANHPLQILLNAVIKSPYKSEEQNLTSLKKYLNQKEQDCKLLLGKYFVDVLLISNAQFNFSRNRDKSMFSNLKLLYNNLVNENETPKFFASFGTGHIDLKNKKGLAYTLLKSNDSPVKNNVCLIGTEYYNCRFYKDKTSKRSDGILDYLCKSSTVNNSNNLINNKEKTITFLSKDKLSNLACNKALNEFSGIIIIKNFDATLFWTWE